jgi:hypothetical protein
LYTSTDEISTPEYGTPDTLLHRTSTMNTDPTAVKVDDRERILHKKQQQDQMIKKYLNDGDDIPLDTPWSE